MAGNSPQNPARPGRPRDAKAQKPRIHPSLGAWMRRPPRRDSSRVWNRSWMEPARKKSIPVMRPWATMPNTAALIPNDVRVAMPSITKPMWATEEKAISRFMSRWARHPSAP
jgi:hypothetical protein